MRRSDKILLILLFFCMDRELLYSQFSVPEDSKVIGTWELQGTYEETRVQFDKTGSVYIGQERYQWSLHYQYANEVLSLYKNNVFAYSYILTFRNDYMEMVLFDNVIKENIDPLIFVRQKE